MMYTVKKIHADSVCGCQCYDLSHESTFSGSFEEVFSNVNALYAYINVDTFERP